MKKVFVIFMILMFCFTVAACGGNNQTPAPSSTTPSAPETSAAPAAPAAQPNDTVYNIKLAHVGDNKHHYQEGGLYFKELIEERSNGQIKVDVYGNSELGDERSILEGMQMGSIEMGIITSGPLSGFVPDFAIVDLGYLFNTKEEAKSILQGEVGQALSAKMQEAGIINLGDISCGFRNVYSKKPITSLDAIKGMTIRTMENPSHMACFKAIGANPVPMAYGELYTALQQGTVDGAENVPDMYFNSKHYEVAPEMALTEHVYLVVMWMVSDSFYQQLPADLQKLVQECAAEAIVYEEDIYDKNVQVVLDELSANGVTFHTIDKDAFREAALKSWDEQATKVNNGVENLAKIKQQLGL